MQVTIASLLGSFLLATGFGAWSVAAPTGPALPAPYPSPLPRPLPPPQLCPDRPDLAVLTPTIDTFGHYGEIRVCAPIKNIGGSAWSSNADQLDISFYNDLGGARVVDGFSSLTAGSTSNVCAWISAPGVARLGRNDLQPGECVYSTTVTTRLTFDPDISIDGNTANDDCRADNNLRHKVVEYVSGCLI